MQDQPFSKLFLSNIRYILMRDLDRLMAEVHAYENEADLWELRGDISNSPGTLCVHVAGNLNHFIGARLGNTGYVRDRPLEFSERNVSRAEIVSRLEATRRMVDTVLSTLPPEKVTARYPEDKFPETPDTAFLLTHLTGHLTYHLGQVNYHRRMG